MGMDRDAINESVFLGIAVPQNWNPHPTTLWYAGADWSSVDANYDPDAANAILDGLGLTAKDSEGYRTRLDGAGPIELAAVLNPDESVDISEMLQNYWKAIGIKYTFRSQNAAHKPIRANQEYMGISIDLSCYQANPWAVTWTSLAPLTSSNHAATKIGEWYYSAGKSGMAKGVDTDFLPLAPEAGFPADPDGGLESANDLWQSGRAYPKLDPKRIEIGKEIFTTMAGNKYFIGTVAFSGTRRGVYFQRNNFRNVPITHSRDQFGFWRETYFFEDGKDNYNHPGNKSRKFKSVSFLSDL
jgi:hypothetical protein